MVNYIISIVTATIIASVISMLTPDGWNKYVGVVTGIIVTVCIARPVINIIKGDVFGEINILQETRTKVGEDVFSKEIKKEMENRIATDARERLKKDFERDRFYPLITGCFERLINGESVPPMTYTYQDKAVYHGKIEDKVLREKFEEYGILFFNKSINDYSENFEALTNIIEYCNENNIRLRVVHMPWNPDFEKPQLVRDVREKTDKILAENNVEILDLEDSFGPEYFYDTGHLNYDVGSSVFTQTINQWL